MGADLEVSTYRAAISLRGYVPSNSPSSSSRRVNFERLLAGAIVVFAHLLMVSLWSSALTPDRRTADASRRGENFSPAMAYPALCAKRREVLKNKSPHCAKKALQQGFSALKRLLRERR
jgi:hypothetical protein